MDQFKQLTHVVKKAKRITADVMRRGDTNFELKSHDISHFYFGRPYFPPVLFTIDFYDNDGNLFGDEFGDDWNGSNSNLIDLLNEALSDIGVYVSEWRYTQLTFELDRRRLPEDYTTDMWHQSYHNWICDTLAPEYNSIYLEFIDYFANDIAKVHDISPRQFEFLVEAIFRNNGFRTELGTGQNDGGVDIRLYNHDVFGRTLTLVQVKRYSPHRPIGIEPVAALNTIAQIEGAERGIFVTTSRFLPSARKISKLLNGRIILADRDDLEQWLKRLEEAYQLGRAERPSNISLGRGNVGKILRLQGYHSSFNIYFQVELESEAAVLIRRLATKHVDRNSRLEVPDLDNPMEEVYRGKKHGNGAELHVHILDHFLHEWDGKPNECSPDTSKRALTGTLSDMYR